MLSPDPAGWCFLLHLVQVGGGGNEVLIPKAGGGGGGWKGWVLNDGGKRTLVDWL